MRFIFLLLFTTTLLAQNSSLLLTEIMFYAQTGNNEFVEIYNNSNAPISLSNLKVKYSDSNPDSIAGSNNIIQPGQYAVIFEGDYDLNSGLYKNFIPAGALILKIVDNHFGSNGMSNSNNRMVSLLLNNFVVDSITYSADNLEDYSEERSDFTSSIWGNSRGPKGTPGKKNSLMPFDYNLMIVKAAIDTAQIVINKESTLSFTIKNSGSLNISAYNIEIYDSPDDSIEEGSELIFQQNFFFLNPGEELTQTMKVVPKNVNNRLIIRGMTEYDENPADNKLILEFKAKYDSSRIGTDSLIINEIMFAPEDECEWIELYNSSSRDIELKNLKISDNTSTVNISSGMIKSRNYLVIAKDTTFLKKYDYKPEYIVNYLPSLNNSGDVIIVKDSLNKILDLVNYSNSLNVSGKSLEKVHPDSSNLSTSWMFCSPYPTPGKINSISKKNYDINLTEAFYQAGKIHYKLKNSGRNTSQFLIKINEDKDKDSLYEQLLEERLYSLNPGDSIESFFNYSLEEVTHQRRFCINVYYAEDEFVYDNSKYINVDPLIISGSILINEIMPNTVEGSEWIELYNNSGNTYLLKNWKICDKISCKILPESEIKPYTYLILIQDTTLLSTSINKVQVDLSFLNRVNETVYLKSVNDIVVDSISYTSSGYEISLERYFDTLITCVDTLRNTAGKENSIASIEEYEANDIVINEVMFTPVKDADCFIELYNKSGTPKNLALWKYVNAAGYPMDIYSYNRLVNPGEYTLLLLPSLNKNGVIVIKDFFGNVIDSLVYDESLHSNNVNTTGRSIERINPSIETNNKGNWGSSVFISGTPSQKNSIFTEIAKSNSSIKTEPNPFSPDNDGFEDYTTINLSLNKPYSIIKGKIFDSQGRVVRHLAEDLYSGSTSSIIFDGLDDNKNPLRIGIYIVYLETYDNNGSKEIIKTTVVVARRL